MYGLKSAVISSFLAFSIGASAAPVTVDLDYTGFEHGSRTGTLSDNGSTQGVAAGQFQFSVSNVQGISPFEFGDSVTTFCVQIDALLDQSNQTYELVEAASYFNNAALVNNIGALVTGHQADVSNANTSAAFQLALWELINEDSDQANLANGDFLATPFGGARVLANEWLSDLDTVVNGFELYVLRADNSQDQLVFTPQPADEVPEPGTLALFGLVLAVLGLKRLHKKTD